MNSLERNIYNLVRFSPRLKKIIVYLYQRIFSLIPQRRVKSKHQIINRKGFFFGFHDKCPWSVDDRYLLAHKVSADLNMPEKDDHIDIGIFKGEGFDEFIRLGSTNTWNWQMGSMLQWIGNKGNIIYNDYDGEKHISKIVDISGSTLRKNKRPIAAVSPDGKYGLSHSFIRLRKAAPAYGYANGEDISSNENHPKDDGIYLMDLTTGSDKLILSLNQFYLMDDHSENSYHYFTHCLFSPSGNRFAFYHRWVERNGQTKTNLFTSDLNGENLHQFKFSEVVTHLAWQDETNLLAYGYKKGIGDHYYLLSDQTNDYQILGEKAFSSDGHPQFASGGHRFITDTYPDRLRRQYLIQFDLETNTRTNIAILRSPLKFKGDVRCDLHPRWDRSGKRICFDSAHTGVRSLCTIDLK